METLEINKVEIRNLQKEDYDQLASSFTRVYADGSDVFWTPKQIDKLIRIFPEGQIVVVVDGKIVGCALSIIVNYDDVKNDHTYAQVTGNETFDTHTRKGNILYGIEVFIHPDYRGLRLARRMYEYRKELCEKLNLKAIMFGGRLPNYHKYAEQMRPKEYIDKVRQREIVDPVLLFQLSNDFHVRKVMRNYLPNDEESRHYACLLQYRKHIRCTLEGILHIGYHFLGEGNHILGFSLHQKLYGSLCPCLDHCQDRPLLRLHNSLVRRICRMLDTVTKIGDLQILQSL